VPCMGARMQQHLQHRQAGIPSADVPYGPSCLSEEPAVVPSIGCSKILASAAGRLMREQQICYKESCMQSYQSAIKQTGANAFCREQGSGLT
jgi:hypothetical protein